MIHSYLKIPENFVRLFLQDAFWVVHIPPFRMVKFKLFAQFPVDSVPHPIMSSLIHNNIIWRKKINEENWLGEQVFNLRCFMSLKPEIFGDS